MTENVYGRVIVGYHGCDLSVGTQIVEGAIAHLRPSENAYDWLGHGIYFYEDDFKRALEFAKTAAANPSKNFTASPINDPFVIGAVICLGNCLDVSKQSGIAAYKAAYDELVAGMEPGFEMPVNRKASDEDDEIILRHLDRAVINFIHGQRTKHKEDPYDTVRGLFNQGDSIVPTSAVRTLSHVQIAVRNTDCIMGYFYPSQPSEDPFQGLNVIPPLPYRKASAKKAA